MRWTFVVNGDPPQVGVSAGSEHLASSLEVPPMRKLLIAEVVATTALEGAVDETGRLVVPRVRFFGMTAGSGEHYTMGNRVGNIGMTVGRNDVKY